MASSWKLTLAQYVFTLLMYAIGVVVLGLALFPSVYLVFRFWFQSAGMILPQRVLFFCFMIVFGYFFFGITLIFVASAARKILRLDVREGIHRLGSPQMLKWMMSSALIIAVRFVFMEFMKLTPFCALFYKLMGAKLGNNVQINSERVGDLSMLEIGDNSVIGGDATVICHSFEKGGLNVQRVKIGKNVIIGLNSIILPGCVINDNAVIAAGAILPKGTVVEANQTYFGVGKK